jgi:hypothetical protein
MNSKIDIIIPFCNPNDEEWKFIFDIYKRHYNPDSVASDDSRYRDLGLFKYLFRGLELNESWINKIFLIVSSMSQIPDWLNTNHEKLNIILHKEYIPQIYLPTFNSSVIYNFIHNISDLSDNFILCDDDSFFIKKLPDNYFFQEDRPVTTIKKLCDVNNLKDGYFNQKLINIANLLKTNILYSTFHLPYSCKKEIFKIVNNIYKNEIEKVYKNSPFRCKKNLSPWLFFNYQIINGITKNVDYFSNRGFINLKDNMKLIPISRCGSIVCINDTEALSEKQFDKYKNFYSNELNKIFPKKSKYEL